MLLDSLFLSLYLLLGADPEGARDQPSGEVRTEVVREDSQSAARSAPARISSPDAQVDAWHSVDISPAGHGAAQSRWQRRTGYWWDSLLGRRIDAALARAHDEWHRRYGNKPRDPRWIQAHEELHWQIERAMTSGLV